MTRQEFLDILNREPTANDVVSVLTEFCQKQKDKYEENKDLVDSCIVRLLQTNQWPAYFNYAKDSLMADYNICILYDTEKMTPFGPTRQPLKFY